MKNRLLFLSFYYYPDLSAGSFRSTSLVDEFSVRAGKDWEIDVLTTLPNRYSSFSIPAVPIERKGPVTVRRIDLPRHKSGMYDQSLAFINFAWKVKRAIKGRLYDAVFATSSRLGTGVLGAWIANSYGVPLYLDIRDIFADTLNDVLQGSKLRMVLPAVRIAEQFAVTSAATVNVVSAGFLPYFKGRNLKNRFSFFPNAIDEEFLNKNFTKAKEPGLTRNILYAGNIGEGQGLHRIIPNLARMLGSEWQIMVIGDGGRRRELEEKLHIFGITNVKCLNPVPRSRLIELYKQADVLFLHLNDYKAFKRVLPSKIFEYAVTGKPVLAGVGGYAAAFLLANVDNTAVFTPCDSAAAVAALNSLRLGHSPREAFVAKYSRRTIVREMVEDMLKTFGKA